MGWPNRSSVHCKKNASGREYTKPDIGPGATVTRGRQSGGHRTGLIVSKEFV